jgi:ubiquinone/menaquinone biosynthesis C-methylase UbiE
VFDLVTFGSSFNVCDQQLALKESARILKSKGWFACLWNHRNLNDPIQSEIEKVIKNLIPEYGYGSRREDQKQSINESALFGEVIYLESDILHKQSIGDCIKAWESHATLERQSGESFPEIITEISNLLSSTISKDLNHVLEIPYTTRIWMAQKKV